MSFFLCAFFFYTSAVYTSPAVGGARCTYKYPRKVFPLSRGRLLCACRRALEELYPTRLFGRFAAPWRRAVCCVGVAGFMTKFDSHEDCTPGNTKRGDVKPRAPPLPRPLPPLLSGEFIGSSRCAPVAVVHRGRLSRPSRRGSVHARRLPQVRDPSAETARSATGPPQPRPEYLLGGAFEVIGIMGCEHAREATASCGGFVWFGPWGVRGSTAVLLGLCCCC